MAIALDLGVQFVQMLLVLAAAPLLTGYVRKVKANLVRRQGPPLLQPYRDLIRLLRKDLKVPLIRVSVCRRPPRSAQWRP